MALSTLGDHVRLKEAALKEDVVLEEGLNAGGKDSLSYFSTDLN